MAHGYLCMLCTICTLASLRNCQLRQLHFTPKLDKQTERAEFNKQTQYFDCTAHTCGQMDKRTGRQTDKRTDKAYERVCQELVHVS